jgi:hypothetical protein
MDPFTLTAGCAPTAWIPPATPVPPTEVSAVALPLLDCTSDTSDTPKESNSLPFDLDCRAVPNADAALVGYHFRTPVAGEVHPDTFDVRTALFRSHHVPSKEAGILADRLGRRDSQNDDRRLCLECCHLSGSVDARRCSNWRVTGMRGRAIPGDLVDLLQRCAGFAEHAAPEPPLPSGTALAALTEPAQVEDYSDE